MAEEIKFKLGLDLKGASKAMGSLLSSANKIGKALGKAGSVVGKGFSKAITTAGNGLKGIAKITAGGLGLGVISAGFGKMTEQMGANAKTQKILNSTMNLFIGLANGVIEVLEPMFDWFFKAFTNPKQWWDDLVLSFENGAKWIKENLIDYVLAGMATMLDKVSIGFLTAKKSWNEFVGDTEEAEEIGKKIEQINKDIDERNKKQEERAKNVKKAVSDVVTFVTNAGNTIGKNVKKIMDNNDALISFEKSLGLLEIAYQGIIEKYDKLAEVQRQARDDENKTIEERLAANEKLGQILDEQAKEEIANLDARIQKRQENMAILGYSWDREKEILDLQKEKAAVDAKITGFRSEQQSNENALKKEQLELQLSEKQNSIDLLNTEMEIAIAKEDNAKRVFEIQREYAKKTLDEQNKMYDFQISQLKEGTQAYQDAVAEKEKANGEYNLKTAQLDKEQREYQNDLDKADADAEKEKLQNKLDTYNDVANKVKQLVGEDTQLGMALSISQAIADTYVGATKAFAQGGVLGYIGAGAVIATGMANVKKIADEARKVDALVGGGGSSGGASPMSVGPSIGLVGGQVNNQSQIMASMDASMQKPAKSYVVSTDMSSQQSLDRRTRQNATLGG
jgi:hypothetical protein